jgi:cell division protein FtsB
VSDRPFRRQYRRFRNPDRGTAAEELEARLAELRDEMRRIEAELIDLRGGEEAIAEGP